jgi:hypothetical protein
MVGGVPLTVVSLWTVTRFVWVVMIVVWMGTPGAECR